MHMKPGWKSSEFWLSVLSHLVSIIGSAVGFIPPAEAPYAIAAATVLSSVYTAARAVVKAKGGKVDGPDTLDNSVLLNRIDDLVKKIAEQAPKAAPGPGAGTAGALALAAVLALSATGCSYSTRFKETHDLDRLAACEVEAARRCEAESRKPVPEPVELKPSPGLETAPPTATAAGR